MYKAVKISMTVLMAYAIGFFLAFAVAAWPAAADNKEDHKKANSAAESKKSDQKENHKKDNSYVYIAQPGDSYTRMARKAVQTYGIDNQVKLSGSQIIFAETKLTNQANPGLLNIGQEVKLSKDAVKSVVSEAQKLSEAQQKAWQYYVQFVDFNTDKVGRG